MTPDDRTAPDTATAMPIRHHRVERLPDDDPSRLICVRCGAHADNYGDYMDDDCPSIDARRDDDSDR